MKKYLLMCPFDHSECRHTEPASDLDCCECGRYNRGIQEAGSMFYWPTKWQSLALGIYIVSGIIVILTVIYVVAYWTLQLIDYLR